MAVTIKIVGKIESCLQTGSYLTVNDTSNPDPNGGLVIMTDIGSLSSKCHIQKWALVSTPEFQPNRYIIVNYPEMDMKLCMSDRAPGRESRHVPRIVEIVKLDTPITKGSKLPTPVSSDCLFTVECTASKHRIIRCVKEPKLVLEVAFGKTDNGTPVFGNTCQPSEKKQMWTFEKSF